MAETRLSDLGNLIYAGLDAVFNRALLAPRQIYYKNIVKEKQVNKRWGWYETIGTLGAAKEVPEGQAIEFDKIQDGHKTTIETKKFAKGVQASQESMKFDLYSVINQQFGTPLVTKMIQLKERNVADAYNNAFTSTGADGVAIISNSHPLLGTAGKLNDNLLTGELSTSSIITAKNMFNQIYDQAGEFFDTRPTHLLIHPNKEFLALQLLNSQLMALELSNTKNVLQDVMPIKVIVNKYLSYNNSTDVSPWFMLDMTLDAGLVLQTEGGMELKTWWDYTTLSYKGIAAEYYGTGFIAPGYGIVGSVGS